MSFPVNLTSTEKTYVEAYIKAGTIKGTAALCNHCAATVAFHLKHAMRKAGLRNINLMAFEYQRWACSAGVNL